MKDIPSLKKVLESGKAENLPRFGKKTVEKLREGLALIETMQGRTLLGEAQPIVENLLKQLSACKEIEQMEVAGSYRRREETIGDVDILVIAKEREKVADFVTSLEGIQQILGKGDTKVSVLLANGLQIDVRMIAEEHYGASLQYFTGSKAHNVALRTYAKEKGFKISEYGLFRVKSGKKTFIAGRTEEELYEKLGMEFIPPEIRQANGEIEAALKHELPSLVEETDIKGDLHIHSTWSDGRDSIEAMAKAADERGYEYIAISDHSPSLTVAGGPKTRADILRKKKEIEAVQKKVNVRILCGTEVDILANGILDYPDDVLQECDIVIAAIHSGFERDNTNRLLRAIEHPLVHAIAHPTGRNLGSRKSYPFDEEKVFHRASETGTWLEINGQPSRLDLPYGMCRKAKAFGVEFLISTDAHSASTLHFMNLGVSVAKRGWLEKDDVVNTLSFSDFLKRLRE